MYLSTEWGVHMENVWLKVMMYGLNAGKSWHDNQEPTVFPVWPNQTQEAMNLLLCDNSV